MRIKWDQYETALLIETFWKIEEAHEKKSELIEKLSHTLRKIAVNRGIEIDAVYRNVNGISMQLAPIAHAFFPDRPTLTTSTMFQKMVQMYNNDRKGFNSILSEAHKLAGDEMGMEESITNSFRAWLESKDIKRYSVQSLIQSLESVSDYCIRRGLITIAIWNMDNPDEFIKAMYKMLAERSFNIVYRVDRPIIERAISLYKSYLEEGKAQEQAEESLDAKVTDSVANDEEGLLQSTEIEQVLDSHYPYGFNYSSPIELMRFRKSYANDIGSECVDESEELIKRIKGAGIEFSGKIYVVKKETIQHIVDIIDQQIDLGRSIFYYESLFSTNEEWMFDERIVSEEMLKSVLIKELSDFQYKSNYFLTQKNRCTEKEALIREISFVWGDYTLRTFSELDNELPYVPLHKIKYALTVGEEFVWNSFETYTRIGQFVITENQLEEIESKAAALCDEKGSASFDEIITDDVVAENFELSETALNDIVFSKISNLFSRNGKAVTRKGENNNIASQVENYCRARETCTVEELNQLMIDLTGEIRYPVIVEAANSVMVRIDKDSLVADSKITFDVEKIDAVLNDMVEGNVMGLKEFSSFATLPYCGFPWNHFLLESFCRRFSKRFRYACMTPNSNNAGAIVRKECDASYHELMAEAVAHANVGLNEKDVFEYLISSGLLLRKKYNNMDDLIQRSKDIREGRI